MIKWCDKYVEIYYNYSKYPFYQIIMLFILLHVFLFQKYTKTEYQLHVLFPNQFRVISDLK